MRLFLAVAMSVTFTYVSAQDISFMHLNIADGLSDNMVPSAARDAKGILWIGTGDGLNSYDGFSIKKYYKETQPVLSNNSISSIVVDEKDRIWLRDLTGKITCIDEKRNFIAVPVTENGKPVTTTLSFFKTKDSSICILSRNKIFRLNEKQPLQFELSTVIKDTTLVNGFIQPTYEITDTLIVIGDSRFSVLDLKNHKVLHTVDVPGLIAAAWLSKNEILATTDRDHQLLKINLNTNSIVHDYGNINDQYGEPVKGYLRHMRKLTDGRFVITSGYGGLYIFDAKQEKFYRYAHDPLNKKSISANNTAHVFTDKDGYVFITTRTAGLNYFNINYQLAGYRTAFQETSTGKIFNGFINAVTKHKNGNFWLGTQTGLMEWNREMNHVKFHEYGTINNAPLNGVEEVRALFFDKDDKLWVGLNRYGIVVLDKNRRPIKYISADKKRTPDTIPGNWINSFTLSPDNKLWVATGGGLCIINPEMKVEQMDDNNVLKPLSKFQCFSVYFRAAGEVWLGTSRGIYRYISSSNQLTRINIEKTNLQAFCFAEDKNGIVYAGTNNGITLIKDTTVIKTYSRLNGLVNDNCFGLMHDADDNIWIGNDNILLRYNPTDSSFKKYNESTGLNPNGYRTLSYYHAEDDEQIWGSDLGLAYFKPADLNKLDIPFSVHINSFYAGNELIEITSGKKLRLPYSQNNLLFGFTAIDLFSNKNIIYEYKLIGADDDWKQATSPQQVAYPKLSSGSYEFKVRASEDGINWTEAQNSIIVTIKTPWWRTTAFIIVYILLIGAVIYYFIRSRSNKIREQREELETEQAINYFATSMTGQGSVGDTLWDVAKNCISRLGFEDCVIYLLDENKKVLIQKAAWGPKTTHENKILNPIEIPLGKGIVGTVAETSKAELINDTSKDERYIVDDTRRWSEIAVPIISNNKVLGVIDSEHSKKNFFTKHHLSILTTIASLCANKIVRAKAEEEKLKAETSLMETERQTAEMEMQALRAQMNPHFMFNSLNSINNFILKNDPDNASQYLTRFSRLMRLILDNSREEWVLLENELKALQLYIEMEAIRFDNVFDYKISTALDVNPSSVIVPPMIVQPYVENAIWHGLLHRKEPGSKLQIDIWKNNGELFIRVEDNGVGREEAEHLKSKFSSHKKSHGMKITAKRLDMVNKIYKVDAKVKIEDLKNGTDKSAGTSVLLQLKYKTSHND